MATYIDNGININAAWESHIAISTDGAKWQGIHKEGVNVLAVFNGPEPHVLLKKDDTDTVIERINPRKILNQPTWTNPAISDIDAVYQAVADIMTWFPTGASASAGLATEATQLNVLSTLSSLFSEQKIDFELKCVEDSNGDMFLLRVLADEPAGTYTFDYIDATGAVATPVGAVTFCSPNALLTQMLTELQTLNATDFATETTADAAATSIANLLTAFGLVDFSTETTLDALLTAFNAVDFSTAANQALILAQLTTLNATDFATETTLAAQAADIEKLVGFAITEFDYIALTYVPSGNGVGEIQTATYKLGGAAGTTVATLTLTYDASNRILTVTKS